MRKILLIKKDGENIHVTVKASNLNEDIVME